MNLKKYLEDNLVAIILIILMEIYAYYFPDNKNKYYFPIAFILLAMIAKWFNINKNKKSLIFYIGLLYIVIPMIYWIFNTKYIDTLVLFFIVTIIYSVFSFFLFKLIDGIFTNINKKFLNIIASTFSALFISYLTLRLKSLPNNCPMSLCKDYLTISTLSMSTILLISDFIFNKIQPILEYNDIKELNNTDSIVPTRGIYIKISNTFLFTSCIYIIYIEVLKIIYRIFTNT